MEDLAATVAPFTKSGPERIAGMIDALRRIDEDRIVGDIVECGIWRGGNIILARKLSPDRVCWLYDTFTGMTEPGEFDVKRSGAAAITSYRKKEDLGQRWAAASVAEVKDILRQTQTLDEDRLRFIVGDVAVTLRDPLNLPDAISLLRLDTDWYASTKVELEVLYPRLVPGGILIIDDYGHWLGARKAVDEYLGATAKDLTMIDYTAAMLVKPC